MKRLVLTFIGGILVAGLMFSTITARAGETASKTVQERVIDILLKKKIITRSQYEELVSQAKKETATSGATAKVGFDKGFYLQSANGESKIRFDGRFHGDFKSYLGDHPSHASFFVRRARLCASGTLYRYYDFRVEPEFGKGGARLNDGFINIHFWPYAQFKVGQFKTPFSMEEQHSDNWIDFVERSLANKLVPSRDLGAMIHGGLYNDKLYYQVGIFNGYKLNKVSDPDGGKDLAMRLVLTPFKDSQISFVKGLHVGAAVTRGHEDLNKNDWWNSGKFKTAAGTTYMEIANGVVQKGTRTRRGVELNWSVGSVLLQSELMDVRLEGMELGTQRDDFNIKGGYVYLSWFPTGENFTFKNGKPGRVIPLRAFRPHDPSSGWGAVQLGVRLEFLRADKGLLQNGYVDSSRYTDEAKALTAGINWYPNEMVRFMLNYSHVKFSDPILVNEDTLDDEDVILSRFEIVF